MNEIYNQDVKILDGGFGTQISKRAGRNVDGDVLWSARFLDTNKQAVIDTHLDFLNAGSDIIETNTYQASIEGFKKYLNLNEDESYRLIIQAVELAKTARDIYTAENCDILMAPPLIAGSVGPYGASLHDGSEYTGSYATTTTMETLKEWHMPRISALVEGGVNLLAFETLPCKIEAEVLLNLIKDYPSMKAWLSFTCRDGQSLVSGENFQEVLRHCYDLNPTQLVAVGANCLSPIHVEELFTGINHGREDNPMPLIVYPNSGESYNKQEGWSGKDKCEPINTFIHTWLNLGIRWIGGCCRMYADEIKKIKFEVKKWRESHNTISQ